MRIRQEGFPYIFPALILGILLTVLGLALRNINTALALIAALGILLLVFGLFCVFFFRDPNIVLNQEEGAVLSPCNGTVFEVEKEGEGMVIRTFLSIFNVHLQRTPVAGKVLSVEHKDGRFLAAWKERAYLENEQNSVIIESKGKTFVVQQIAGFLARRCVCWVKPGDQLERGDRFGLIKFSSQVDLHLPPGFKPVVERGSKVSAGLTVMARPADITKEEKTDGES
jgi:phosphatidylserine decarboxylase